MPERPKGFSYFWFVILHPFLFSVLVIDYCEQGQKRNLYKTYILYIYSGQCGVRWQRYVFAVSLL